MWCMGRHGLAMRWVATVGTRETKDLATRRINRGFLVASNKPVFVANVAREGWLGLQMNRFGRI